MEVLRSCRSMLRGSQIWTADWRLFTFCHGVGVRGEGSAFCRPDGLGIWELARNSAARELHGSLHLAYGLGGIIANMDDV